MTAVAALVLTAAACAGCSAPALSPPAPTFEVSTASAGVPSAPCAAAFDEANMSLTDLYAHHPMYNGEYDRLRQAPASEQTTQRMAEIDADERDQYEERTLPVLDACHGREDLYSGASAADADEYWGVDGHDLKLIFLRTICDEHTSLPACATE